MATHHHTIESVHTSEKHRPAMFHTATVRPTKPGPNILYNTPLKRDDTTISLDYHDYHRLHLLKPNYFLHVILLMNVCHIANSFKGVPQLI